MQRAPNPRELREGTGATLRFRPSERWASATGLVKSQRGQTIQTGAATVDPVDTTVVFYPDATQDTFQLADTTGVQPGWAYLVSSDELGSSLVEVSTVDPGSGLVTLVTPLPSVSVPGSLFQGVEVTFAVDPIADRATNYRAVVRGPGQGQEEAVRFDVVSQPWKDPIGAEDVREYISHVYPGSLRGWSEERAANLAQGACDEVRRKLRQADQYPSRFWDTSDLAECCITAMIWLLAREGLYPGNADPTDYKRQLHSDLRHLVSETIVTNAPYDSDDDGAITTAEADSVWHGELTR